MGFLRYVATSDESTPSVTVGRSGNAVVVFAAVANPSIGAVTGQTEANIAGSWVAIGPLAKVPPLVKRFSGIPPGTALRASVTMTGVAQSITLYLQT